MYGISKDVSDDQQDFLCAFKVQISYILHVVLSFGVFSCEKWTR
jgi:hypothetical protein